MIFIKIITAALPYANGFLHLGHIASTFLPADIYARFCKLKEGEKNILFVCATDEHGTPIELNALKYNLPPIEFVKIFRKEHNEELSKISIKFDNFYYTHSEENKKLTYMFYEKAKEKNLIYEKEVKALYCETCKRFLPDRFVKGTCKFCDAENQYGDVCEVCGRTYHAQELKNPYCILCKNTPVVKSTTHVFFALKKLENEIKKYLESNEHLQEDAKNYALSWIKEGLKDIDITRDAPYFGFPIPDKKDKYFYVWVDAPFGYIASALNHDKKALEYWKNDSTKIIHFMGKDIIYFHYIYWIGMLKTADLCLPTSMPARGYLTLNKKKMSKSRNNFIYLRDLEEFIDENMIRYYFARNIPDNIADGDFSFDIFLEKTNKELVGIIANLGYRMLKIGEKMENYTPPSINLKDYEIAQKVEECIEEFRIKDALEHIVEFAVKINEKFNAYEPWKIVKSNEGKEKIDELFADVIALFMLLEPYLPSLSKKFYECCGIKRKSYEEVEIENKSIKPQILIKKIDDETVKLITGEDDFCKLDLKIGKIVDVKDIKESEKLYHLTLDVGENKTKKVVAGIKKYYKAEELLNKKVVFINNMKKTQILGYESEGMLIAASSKDNTSIGLAYVDDPLIPPGSEVTIKGIFKNPSPEIDISFFKRINLIKEKDGVKYKNLPLIARSLCKEAKILVENSNSIEDGAKLW